MNMDQIVNDAIAYVAGLLGENSGGHDTDHSLRVYKMPSG